MTPFYWKKSKSNLSKAYKLSVAPEDVFKAIRTHMLVDDVFPLVLDIEKSKGNFLFDSKSKRSFLDCFSFIASNAIGYGHPKLDEPVFEAKLLRAAKLKVSNSDLLTAEMAEFVETFARIAKPNYMKHLFFVEGGALAVENALKAAFDWKVRLNFAAGCKEERGHQVLHFKEAFHGRSGYTLTLTNTDPKKTKYFPRFDWPRVVNPKVTFPIESNLAAIESVEKESLDQIASAFKEREGEIAAIILEPIQGEGGDNHFRPSFHQALRKIADENQALLIYDEVQSGVGLTGKMWAHQHYGIEPDAVAFGKKTQVCGMMFGSRIDQAKDNVFVETSRINSTWGGNLVDMVRCGKILEIIEEEKLVENAAAVGTGLLSMLEKLQGKFAGVINNARGRGLMCAVDVVSAERRSAIIKKALELGVIVLPSGARSIRFRPPLTFSADNVIQLADIFEQALRSTQ